MIIAATTLLLTKSINAQHCMQPASGIRSAAEDAFNAYATAYRQDGKHLDATLQYIPVVVHIIMRTPADSINPARVQSQIDASNLDLRRLNADTTRIRPVFRPVAADCQLQLCLATRKPNGQTFGGILWHYYPDFPQTQLSDIKAATILDPERYLNVWILPEQEGGYAIFPWDKTSLDDGFTVGSTVFGTFGSDLNPAFNEGGIFTHELGHYLGLYHTFHDGFIYLGECGLLHNGDIGDRCADTPLDWDFPIATDQCNDGTRICSDGNTTVTVQSENFMYYNRDSCMQMFSLDQRIRMRACTDSARALLVSEENLQFTGVSCSSHLAGPQAPPRPVIQVYPNPFANYLHVELPQAAEATFSLEIQNINGQKVWQAESKDSKQIYDLQHLPSGIYILHIKNGSYTDTRKLIRN